FVGARDFRLAADLPEDGGDVRGVRAIGLLDGEAGHAQGLAVDEVDAGALVGLGQGAGGRGPLAGVEGDRRLHERRRYRALPDQQSAMLDSLAGTDEAAGDEV